MGTAARPIPSEFPIFPLPGAMLLPGGKLPLNIFEPRYRSMIEDALGEGRVIGMIQPDENRADTPTGPGLYRVGCVGYITSFSETEDGRFLVTLAGLTRFAISVELEMRRGYRRVRADLARFARDSEPDTPQAGAGRSGIGSTGIGSTGIDSTGIDRTGVDRTGVDREALLRALRVYFTVRGFDANWDAINEMPDAALVSTLSMVCPFEPPEKQVLLEADTTVDRSRALLALLEIGAHLSDTGDERPRPS